MARTKPAPFRTSGGRAPTKAVSMNAARMRTDPSPVKKRPRAHVMPALAVSPVTAGGDDFKRADTMSFPGVMLAHMREFDFAAAARDLSDALPRHVDARDAGRELRRAFYTVNAQNLNVHLPSGVAWFVPAHAAPHDFRAATFYRMRLEPIDAREALELTGNPAAAVRHTTGVGHAATRKRASSEALAEHVQEAVAQVRAEALKGLRVLSAQRLYEEERVVGARPAPADAAPHSGGGDDDDDHESGMSCTGSRETN